MPIGNEGTIIQTDWRAFAVFLHISTLPSQLSGHYLRKNGAMWDASGLGPWRSMLANGKSGITTTLAQL